MKNLQESFNKVKEINWNEAVVSFYVVKRKLVRREAKYKILLQYKSKNRLGLHKN
jgi:hypothetical protein